VKPNPGKRARRPGRDRTPGEVARLRGLLADAQATLHAIRSGEVDAVVIDSKLGPQVYTLDGAESDYRILIESMNEGALVLARDALILYANSCFASMVERPLAQLMGCSLFDLLSAADQATLKRLLNRPGRMDAKAELLLRRPYGKPLPVRVSIQRLPGTRSKSLSIGMVVSDLTEFRRREELLRDFSRSLMQVQEAERQRIATNLGDNITQLLCTILARCQLLTERLPAHEQGFREEAVEFATLLRSTTREVHRISADLRPHGLEILGLDSALRGVAVEFAERMGVAIEVRCAKLSARLPADAELVLYRVLQEALRNVEQHARAQHVRVTFRRRGPVVQLAIKDDGIGFDADELQGSGPRAGRFGLVSMRERAAAVGGSLQLRSTRAGGTEVILSVPHAPSPAAA
jgi:PAS domain S-box-containing protein